MGGGGSSGGGGTAISMPARFPKDITQLRKNIVTPMETRAWEESQFYPAIANMYQGVIGQATPGMEPYAKTALESAVTTGLPMTPQSFMEAAAPYYMGAYPAYQSALDQALAQAKESAGMTGNLRGSAGSEALGRAAAGTTADFLKYLTEQAGGAYQAQAGRQMGALPMAMSAELLPGQEFQGLTAALQGLGAAQFPWLEAAMRMATASPTGSGGSVSQTAPTTTAPTMGCCFIFIEGARLTDNVRRLRDTIFPKGGLVEKGYRRMAKWLVPRMARNSFVKSIIRLTMLNPICLVADHYYGDNSYGWMFRPVAHFWINIWKRLGT